MAVELKNRTVVSMERVKSSKSGNPIFRVGLDNDTALMTKPDAMFAYALVDGQSYIGDTVTVGIDGRGRIVYIEKAGA